jgi:hypothetical protein
MNPLDRSEFFDTMATLEKKLLEQLTTGLGQVNAALVRMQEATHVALLEQECRNSTFATRDLVDRLSGTVDTMARQSARHDTRLSEIAHSTERLADDLETLKHTAADHNLSYIRAGAGFLASILAVILAVVITYVLAHAG